MYDKQKWYCTKSKAYWHLELNLRVHMGLIWGEKNENAFFHPPQRLGTALPLSTLATNPTSTGPVRQKSLHSCSLKQTHNRNMQPIAHTPGMYLKHFHTNKLCKKRWHYQGLADERRQTEKYPHHVCWVPTHQYLTRLRTQTVASTNQSAHIVSGTCSHWYTKIRPEIKDTIRTGAKVAIKLQA